MTQSGCSKFFNNLRPDGDDGNSSASSDSSEDLSNEYGENTQGNNSETSADHRPQQRQEYLSESRTERKPAESLDSSSSYGPSYGPSGDLSSPPRRRTTREDFVDKSQEEGSLWASGGQTNYYFTKNKVRSPGDIVTVKLENDLYKNIISEIKKTLTSPERNRELFDARERLRASLGPQGGSRGLASLDANQSNQPNAAHRRSSRGFD
ncbi:unnamed protein product [Sphagnum tenellum]